MDLQFLPHIFVKNPHIRRVYDAYLHAFDTLRSMPLVVTPEDNARLTDVLQRLVDEHGMPRYSNPQDHRMRQAFSPLSLLKASSASRVLACMRALP